MAPREKQRKKVKEVVEREKFLEPLEPHMSRAHLVLVSAAYIFAENGHRDQERDGGGPYFDHPKAVANAIILELGIKNDWKIIVTALLHDILEDNYLVSEDLIRNNFKETVALWVKLLSKIPKKGYHKRLTACGIWQVLLVKLCDRIHNLRTFSVWSKTRKKKYLAETRKLYLPLAEQLFAIIPKKYLSRAVYLRAQVEEFVGKKTAILEQEPEQETDPEEDFSELPLIGNPRSWN